MCTAISFTTNNHFFGRNLDLHHHYDEAVVISQRNFDLRTHNGNNIPHAAIIGIATVMDQYPLYYDAVNEFGLGIAGLNFPGNAVYHPEKDGLINIASFQLTPWLLSCCKNVNDVKDLLEHVNISDVGFSDNLPPTPLHWMVCDKSSAIVIESVSEGLKVYDNPIGVLTNNPPFPYHVQNISNYLNITSSEPISRFSPNFQLKPYSFGMGGMGLPGDLSSASRFVRAAFVKENSLCDECEIASVNQFFHILDSVSQPCGCVRSGDGLEKTIYSSCCNTEKGIYYYKTYNNSQITGVKLDQCSLDGKALEIHPIRWESDFFYENNVAPF